MYDFTPRLVRRVCPQEDMCEMASALVALNSQAPAERPRKRAMLSFDTAVVPDATPPARPAPRKHVQRTLFKCTLSLR